ncbi:MAG: Os1348 family NHLP clan protein [Ardenticatenaceae bacterium]|nr:Os1348 family NHLP clan protein [Ardenticatenaceae bacterium]
MATQKEMYELLGRALADAEFRNSLIADPVRATAEAGYQLSEEQLTGLKEADLAAVSEGLGERLAKYLY